MHFCRPHFVGNKRKKANLKTYVTRKKKHTKFSEKTSISYPLICTRTCVYQGVRLSENLVCLFFFATPLSDLKNNLDKSLRLCDFPINLVDSE